MKIVILPAARDDLADGFQFYERQQEGLGGYFLDSLFSDIDSLRLYAGIHRKVFGNHRLLSKRFPYAIYYAEASGTVFVKAILDSRRDPKFHHQRLR
jgi:plasmid stabilization system protein ParE